jgi:sugar phosphate isomerase/epimerase
MRTLRGRPDLCAINTATLGFQEPILATIERVARAGFAGIAPWRREVEGGDVGAVARAIRDAGLTVTGYCRSTYIPAADRDGFNRNIDANIAAIRDAAAIGAQSFVMVVGGLPQGSKDLKAARQQVEDAVGILSEHGKAQSVRIALEPLHPMYAADRSCLSTIDEALAICERLQSERVGICLDVYHIWWDPLLATKIAAASGRITGFHVCDWLVPTRDMLNDRGMMGDGVIDIPAIRGMVEEAGYQGLVEVEIFSSENWWKRSPDEILGICAERFASSC